MYFLASLRPGVSLLILLALFRYSQPMGRGPRVPAMRGAGRVHAKTQRRKDAKVRRAEDSVCFLASQRLGVSLLIFLVLLVIRSRWGEDLGCLQCVGRGRVHAKTLRRKGVEGGRFCVFLGISASWRESSDAVALPIRLNSSGSNLADAGLGRIEESPSGLIFGDGALKSWVC